MNHKKELLRSLWLDSKEPTFFMDMYKEVIIRTPKNVGSLGSTQP